jgi:aryl-alcohol dehydrogenase-like predicted oxidoreductase
VALSADYDISRVIRGGWQLSASHSQAVSDDPIGDMVAFADAGITTFDCADIYTGVEEAIGQFRTHYKNIRGADALARIRVHTKFVPDLAILPNITKPYVERVIDTSLKRLNVEQLDLVQFHWWNYAIPRWLETAGWLEELRKAGKILRIGHMGDIKNGDIIGCISAIGEGIHRFQPQAISELQLERAMAMTCSRIRELDALAAEGG